MRSRYGLPAVSGAGILLLGLAGSLRPAVLIAGLIVAVCAAWFFSRHQDRRTMRLFGCTGALAALACALSVRFSAHGATGWDGLLLCLLSALCLGPAAGKIIIWLMAVCKRCVRPVHLQPARAFLISLIVIVLCWLPVILALFPGVTGYDMQSQMAQITSGEYVNGHPIAHTLLLGAF